MATDAAAPTSISSSLCLRWPWMAPGLLCLELATLPPKVARSATALDSCFFILACLALPGPAWPCLPACSWCSLRLLLQPFDVVDVVFRREPLSESSPLRLPPGLPEPLCRVEPASLAALEILVHPTHQTRRRRLCPGVAGWLRVTQCHPSVRPSVRPSNQPSSRPSSLALAPASPRLAWRLPASNETGSIQPRPACLLVVCLPSAPPVRLRGPYRPSSSSVVAYYRHHHHKLTPPIIAAERGATDILCSSSP